VLSNPRWLGLGTRRFGEPHRAGVALDREQELMKLESHPPFGRPIMEVAQGTLEAAKRPVQRQFGMLIQHQFGMLIHGQLDFTPPSSMPARCCTWRPATALRLLRRFVRF